MELEAKDCCHAPICPCIARPSLARSQGSSMKGRERPCSIRPQLRSSQNVLRRSVEPAAKSRHCQVYAERHHVDDVELIGLDKLSDGSCRLDRRAFAAFCWNQAA